MADTGLPWSLPYPLATDLVRDGAQAIEDLAEATADGLDAAGGLVAVKHVLKTDTFSASVTAGNNVAVPDLEITHEVADSANRLIITAFFGASGTTAGNGQIGLAVAVDGTLVGIGDADGIRPQVAAGGTQSGAGADASVFRVTAMSVTFVHTPGAGEKTYTVRAINMDSNTRTLFVNRNQSDANEALNPRAASALVIQEVKV